MASADLAARGTFKHDPKLSRNDLEPAEGKLTDFPPEFLGLTEPERFAWARVMEAIPPQLRGASDVFLVASCSRWVARFIAKEMESAADFKVFLNHLTELGLTEQGRRKLATKVKPPEKEDPKLAQFRVSSPPKAPADGRSAN